ncbi:MAG: hypothetical protein K2N99_01665, partial [Malacoplasma sp.]|nr:hypothetical protein [Malacoplasma sp.]
MGATDAKIYKSKEDEEFKLKQNYVRLGELYKESQNAIRIVDTSTGESIPLQSISDSIRLSKRGDQLDVDKTVVYDHIIPNKLLDDFVISSSQHLNARSCVEALGLYCTEYMKYQVTHLGDKQSDLSAMEDRTAEANLTFRNYIKGGASARNPITGEPAQSEDENDEVKRVTPNLGIGLGEATVLNPTFQFNKRDDPRTNPMYTKIGRVYSTQIMNNWPIIVFQPGRLKYHTGFMKIMGLGGGAGVTEAFIRSGGEGIKGAFLNMLSFGSDIAAVVGTIGSGIFGGSKLVEFRQSANLFNKYVSYLWSMLGQLMGLYSDSGNFNYHYAGEIKHLDATHVLPTTLLSGGPAKYLANQYWPFRIQKGMIGSETFSNSTETNPLMEEMNQQSTANDEAGASQNSFLGSIAKKVQGFLGNFSDKAAVLAGRG